MMNDECGMMNNEQPPFIHHSSLIIHHPAFAFIPPPSSLYYVVPRSHFFCYTMWQRKPREQRSDVSGGREAEVAQRDFRRHGTVRRAVHALACVLRREQRPRRDAPQRPHRRREREVGEAQERATAQAG